MKVKILQWNVWYREKPDNIISLLQEIDADVLCLQEVTIGKNEHDRENIVEKLQQATGFHLHFHEMKNSDDGTQANVILSKYLITNAQYKWINESTGSGGYDDEYRCYIEAELQIKDKTLTVATTHMSYTHMFEETERKLQETSRLIKEAKGKTSYVFTGDLNVTPDSKTIAEISNVLFHAGPDMKEPTWTTKPFDYNGFSATTLDWRLDYIFTSKDVTVSHAEIIDTNFSDHLPILVEIEL